MNMDKYFLIVGMFRSGTTLVSKILHAHDKVACVPDIFTPVFNAFRDQVAKENNIYTNNFEPIGDYFADESKHSIFKANLKASFNLKIDINIIDELLMRIKERGRLTCPKIVRNLNGIKGDTYKTVYQHLVEYIISCYGNGTEEWIGNKEVWITEFLPVLAKAYPKAKFILVNRDPRAVCASKNIGSINATNNVCNEKYPWLFLIRQWRKLAILGWVFNNYSFFKNRILYLQYEDLLKNSKEKIKEICDFLEIKADKKMIDHNCYTNGDGGKWIQNSSYNAIGKKDGYLLFLDKCAAFDISCIDKWKNYLSSEMVEFIEQLCFPEMKLYGYEFYGSGRYRITDDTLFELPMIPVEEMQEWIQKLYKNQTKVSFLNDIAKEKVRQKMITTKKVIAERIDQNVIESYFYDQRYFEKARTLI